MKLHRQHKNKEFFNTIGDFLTPKEVAEEYNINLNTVYRVMNEGLLIAPKMGKYRFISRVSVINYFGEKNELV